MSLARTHIVDPALPDGNCAFNAFALGLCQPKVLNKINLADDNVFVQRASIAFHVIPATWQNLKTMLFSKSKVELQQTLSPILRRLAIQTILTNPEVKAAHLIGTSQAIQVELENYLQNPNRQVGDIFIRHDFIKNKFKALRSSYGNNSQQAKNELITWWQAAGHRQFLNEMAIPARSAADTNRYAGDLELAPLGGFFGVNLWVDSQRRGFNAQMHNANGSLPIELAALARGLADRNIIENQSHYWKDFSETNLLKRLASVPQLKEVTAIFSASHLPIRGQVIANHLTKDCKEELLHRGIIDAQGRFTGIPVNSVFNRILEQANKNEIVSAWKKHYKIAPTISLENQSAAHWNALVEQPKLSAKVSPLATSTRPLTPTNCTSKQTNSKITSKALRPKSATSTASAPAKSKTSTTSVVSYKPSQGEREVNNALMEAFELLDTNRKALGDSVVQRDFENLFNYFQKQLTAYDPRLFSQTKQRTLKTVEQQVQALVTKRP